jgi:hypothetical protein
MKPASEGIVELYALCPHAVARGLTACSSKKKGEGNLRVHREPCVHKNGQGHKYYPARYSN